MRTTVVIPTYNERENISRLLDALLAVPLPELTVLVADDSSPDGTGEDIRRRATRDPRVTLLSRPRKEGLGRAYSAAFGQLLEASPRPDVIVQMDADFSHNPADIPRLLAGIESADLVIGSRYVPDGGTLNWPVQRQILSRGANTLARILTRSAIRDLTGGLSAWRTDLLRAITPWTVQVDGYGYLIELKVRAERRGARIREVPIVFTERRLGQSKLSKRVIWEAAGVVVRLGLSSGTGK